MDVGFLIRAGIAVAAIALALVLIARRERRLRRVAIEQPTLRRRLASPPRRVRRIEAGLRVEGFRTIGEYDLCDPSGKSARRFLLSCNDETAIGSMRGYELASLLTELRNEQHTTMLVQTTMFDVDHTHPRHVVQTVRPAGLRQMIEVHEDAIAILSTEGWRERVTLHDPVEVALRALRENALAHTEGERRRTVEVARVARRTLRNGRAQVGSGVRLPDPAELGDADDVDGTG